MKWICRDCGGDWSPDLLLCPSCGSLRGQSESGRLVVGSSGKGLFPEHPDPDEEIDRLLDEYGIDIDEAEAKDPGESDWLR